jgi:Fic family protein
MPIHSPSSAQDDQANYPSTPQGLETIFTEINNLQHQIDAARPFANELWHTLVNRLRTDWTYHSNTIEGSTLSRGETHFFLTEGLTVEGKPFKDFVDAKNHAQAVDILFEIVKEARPITEGLIKEINALLLQGAAFTPAKTSLGQIVKKPIHPGRYKKESNHVEQSDGSIHYYVDPLHVDDEMQHLFAWINKHINALHPVHTAAVAHYNMVRIHPFDDGNGRGARLLMNLILMHRGIVPAVVRIETKRRYLDVLKQADLGDLTPFIKFVAEATRETQQSIHDVLAKHPPQPIQQPKQQAT